MCGSTDAVACNPNGRKFSSFYNSICIHVYGLAAILILLNIFVVNIL